jgi:hypothetical protein
MNKQEPSELVKYSEPVIERLAEHKILLIRGHKVMLDADLAALYGVETKNLNKAVKRNLERFPSDFMFQLTLEETLALRFQFGTSKEGRGGRRYLPYAFTEQGVSMLSSVLNSPRAIQVNIAIMRAFVKLRELLATHADLARKLAAMEKKHDQQFKIVFDAIRQMMQPPTAGQKKQIGFAAPDVIKPATKKSHLFLRCPVIQASAAGLSAWLEPGGIGLLFKRVAPGGLAWPRQSRAGSPPGGADGQRRGDGGHSAGGGCRLAICGNRDSPASAGRRHNVRYV